MSDVSRKLVQIFFATTALKKDDGIPPGSAIPAADPPARRGRRGLHGRRHRGHRGAQRRGGHPAQGRRPGPGGEGPQGRDEHPATSGSSAGSITRPQYERLSALLSGSDDYRGLRPRRPGDRGGVRGLDAQAPVLPRSRRVMRPDAIFATNTSTIPIADIAAEAGAARARARDALLLAGGEDAAARGDPHRRHRARGDRHRGAVRPAHGQDGDRGRPTDPASGSTASSRPTSTRPGILLEEGVPIEVIDRGHDRVRLPGRPDHAARRGRARRGAEGGGGDARGVRRAAAAGRSTLEPACWPTAAWAGRTAAASTAIATGTRRAWTTRVYDLLGVRPAEDAATPSWCERRLVYAMLNEAAMALRRGRRPERRATATSARSSASASRRSAAARSA